MRRLLIFTLVLLFLSACAAPAAKAPAPEAPAAEAEPEEGPEDSPEEAEDSAEAEDRILLTLEAPLASGRTLTLEAFGRVLDEYSTGVREVRVYDGEDLIQTVRAREGNLAFWGDGDLLPGESVSEYTSCWKPEGCMEAVDLNFDGNTDLGLFAFPANNTIPYYYWTWNAEAEQYQYAFTLQGVEAHPEARELTAEYKSGSAGSQWIVEYYRPDENGELYLDRVHRDTCDFEPEEGFLDVDRGWAEETWVPPDGMGPIRPDDSHWSFEADLVLVRREVPVGQIGEDGTASYFMEIWEFWDGGPQLVERKEYFYDDQPE